MKNRIRYIIYLLLGTSYQRLLRIKLKQKNRYNRVLEAKLQLEKWKYMPIQYLMVGICDILKLKNNLAAHTFVNELCITHSAELHNLAKKLPLV